MSKQNNEKGSFSSPEARRAYSAPSITRERIDEAWFAGQYTVQIDPANPEAMMGGKSGSLRTNRR